MWRDKFGLSVRGDRPTGRAGSGDKVQSHTPPPFLFQLLYKAIASSRLAKNEG